MYFPQENNDGIFRFNPKQLENRQLKCWENQNIYCFKVEGFGQKQHMKKKQTTTPIPSLSLVFLVSQISKRLAIKIIITFHHGIPWFSQLETETCILLRRFSLVFHRFSYEKLNLHRIFQGFCTVSQRFSMGRSCFLSASLCSWSHLVPGCPPSAEREAGPGSMRVSVGVLKWG